MMIKWSFQKLTNVKKKRIKVSYKSCFILIPAMHLILLYGNQKSKKLGRLLKICIKLWEQLPCKQLVILQMMAKEKPTVCGIRSNRVRAVHGSGKSTIITVFCSLFAACLFDAFSIHVVYQIVGSIVVNMRCILPWKKCIIAVLPEPGK